MMFSQWRWEGGASERGQSLCRRRPPSSRSPRGRTLWTWSHTGLWDWTMTPPVKSTVTSTVTPLMSSTVTSLEQSRAILCRGCLPSASGHRTNGSSSFWTRSDGRTSRSEPAGREEGKQDYKNTRDDTCSLYAKTNHLLTRRRTTEPNGQPEHSWCNRLSFFQIKLSLIQPMMSSWLVLNWQFNRSVTCSDQYCLSCLYNSQLAELTEGLEKEGIH